MPSGQGELLQHAPGHGDVEPGCGGVHTALVVLAQAAVAAQPGESAFHDPTLGHDREALGGGVAADKAAVARFHAPAPSRPVWALDSRCLPRPRAGGEVVLQMVADVLGTVPVLEVGGPCTATFSGRPSVSTTKCRLRPLTFWAASYPRPPGCRRFHGWAVDDARAGRDLPPLGCGATFRSTRRPGSSKAGHGQPPPRTAGAQHRQDRIHNFATGHCEGAPARAEARQQEMDPFPLGVGQIGVIGLAFHEGAMSSVRGNAGQVALRQTASYSVSPLGLPAAFPNTLLQ